jgi:hypothetical protein
MTDYDAGGLASSSVNYRTIATLPTRCCSYYVQLQGKQFIVQNLQPADLGHLLLGG